MSGLAGTAALLALSLMGLTFLLARRIGNFSIVDIAWSFNFTPVVAVYALLGDGLPLRRLLIFMGVALWSVRLAVHLARRIVPLHPVEEGRYLELRRRFAGHVESSFLRFFMLQAVLNVGLSIPFLFACMNTSPKAGILEVAGALVFALGLLGESVADAQLNAFRQDKANAGKVCGGGLWRYSRHPNYFFEWLVWCSFALLGSAASSFGWISWVCPALMLYFLLRVTGIPATEEQAERSRGEAYRDYRARTSAFVPWFPRAVAPKVVTVK